MFHHIYYTRKFSGQSHAAFGYDGRVDLDYNTTVHTADMSRIQVASLLGDSDIYAYLGLVSPNAENPCHSIYKIAELDCDS